MSVCSNDSTESNVQSIAVPWEKGRLALVQGLDKVHASLRLNDVFAH